MLSFFVNFPALDLAAKSCHLDLPASNSLFAFTFRGILAGRTGPSLTLLGSRLACCANVGSTFAAAEMTLGLDGGGTGADDPDMPSALRFFASFDNGLMSLALKVSVFP